MRCRSEIDVFHDILCSLEEGRKRKWAIVANTNMNAEMLGRYRIRMLNLGLIREELSTGNSVFEITPKGRKILYVIREYRSLLTSH